METFSDVVEILEDPQFFNKKLRDLQKREHDAVTAEVNAQNKIKELVRAQESLKKEEERLRREVVVLKNKLEEQVGYQERVVEQWKKAYDEKMAQLDDRDKKLRIVEEEASQRISKATQRENLADKKMNEVTRRENLLAEKQEIIDFNLNLLRQIKQ